MNECPLCRLCQGEIITKLHYEDDKVIVVDCSTHLKPMIVLKRHTSNPTEEEGHYMRSVMERLFPGMKLRGPASIRDHFHLHG
jgi:hypothetical protein